MENPAVMGSRYYHGTNGVSQDYCKAAELFLKAANQGNANAQYNLGACYANGHGVKQDHVKAVEWYTKAADQGLGVAQHRLGECFENGRGVKIDLAKAVEWYTKATNQGDTYAQFGLANCYYHGRGVKQDHVKAVEWYSKAADQGFANAQFNLGVCFQYGQGVNRDYAKAVEWFTKAADQGNANAQFNLGVCYENGRGVKQDNVKAVELYTEAADQGFANARQALHRLQSSKQSGGGGAATAVPSKAASQGDANQGKVENPAAIAARYYLGTDGVAQDYFKAVEWYTKAANQGDASAQSALGVCYDNGQGVKQDSGKAVEWYTKAANQGVSFAQYNLGACYENGHGVKQDNVKAVEWFTKAADQGFANAQQALHRLQKQSGGGAATAVPSNAASQGDANQGKMENPAVMGSWYYHGANGVSQDYCKAVEWYTKAANQGDANAQSALGLCYANGQGVKQDHVKAVEWYTKAADQGDANAQFTLGVCHDNGQGVKQDHVKAVEWFTKAGALGDVRAQCILGDYFKAGHGVKQDHLKAVEWYTKAAKLGVGIAQCRLGVCYQDGLGVKQDDVKAVEWYTKAANQGDANAQFNLGVCFQNGHGVKQDHVKAVEWYTKAASQGNIQAQCYLGDCYANGRGGKRDYEKAVKWYTEAADQGNNAAAQFYLGELYEDGLGVKQDHVKAVEWYTKAAKQGLGPAQQALHRLQSSKQSGGGGAATAVPSNAASQGDTKQGKMENPSAIAARYYFGTDGVAQDYCKAVEWYTKAANQGDANAQLALGVCYENGRGVQQDHVKAVEWYSKAADQGDTKAQFTLGVCYANGRGVKQDHAKAVEWFTKLANQGIANAQFNLGVCFQNSQGVKQEHDKAVEWFTKAANQGHASAQFNLGVCYENGLGVKQDHVKAVEWYTKAAKESKQGPAQQALHRLQSSKQSGGSGAATAIPPTKTGASSAAAAPPKPGVFGSTAPPTTEAELLALVKQDSKLSSKAGLVASWIQERDWKSVVDTLQTSSISNSAVVSSLLTNVLGPISEAQGIAKAIIGLAAAIVDMAMTAKANKVKCQKLAVQLNNVKPALLHLENSLSNKTAKIMSAQPPSANTLEQFKRETESLSGPLKQMQRVGLAVTDTIAEWTVKGTKLFGAFRQMLTSKNYAGKFEDLSAELASASQELQLALSVMNFLNLNDVQKQLSEHCDLQKAKQLMGSAGQQDKDDLSNQIKEAMIRDPEFANELKQHFDEISAELKTQFGDLFTYLDGEFHKVHSKLDEMHNDMKKTASMNSLPNLGALSVKFCELVFKQDSNGADFLGEGSFGMVYKCTWGPNKFAVKLLPLAKSISLNAKTKILNEAMKMASVAHRNTVRLRGVCLDEAPYCLVMDLVGPDLHVFLGDFGEKMTWPQRLCMARELASGLEAVHDAGIVHGDVRSPNVLMGPAKARWCRIADFGLSTTRVESTTATTFTIRNTNNVWRAPELLLKPGAKLTKEADVWSLGCVLFEIATGAVPWAGVSLDEVKSFYRDKQCLEIPEDVDSLFVKLIQMCWQFEPKQRPTMRELLKVIGNAGSESIGV